MLHFKILVLPPTGQKLNKWRLNISCKSRIHYTNRASFVSQKVHIESG